MKWEKITIETDINEIVNQKYAIAIVSVDSTGILVKGVSPVYEVQSFNVEKEELTIQGYNPIFNEGHPIYSEPQTVKLKDLYNDWYYNKKILPLEILRACANSKMPDMTNLSAFYNEIPFDFEYLKFENAYWEGYSYTDHNGNIIKQISETPVSGYFISINNPSIFVGRKIKYKNKVNWLESMLYPFNELDKILCKAIDKFESEL